MTEASSEVVLLQDW